MSLFHLKSFVSKEDFADAHEPLNDGVKEVPNAQTVAAGTKTGDVGTDTNSAGPAKVIPEQEDTDDKTEKQFDTVSETAEKGVSESGSETPVGEKEDSGPKAPPAKSDADTSDTQTDSGDGATKAPPFVKKDDAETSEASTDDEPKLEHDTAEATDSEIKKTETATKSLEAYSEHAGRFDIVGYPRKDQDRIRNTIAFINRRAGKSGDVKLSLECISEAVETGKARLVDLQAQAAVHAKRKVSAENYDAVVEQAITTEPTAHGNEPLAPVVAEELTAVETDPLDLPEVAEIGRIQDAIQTLQGAGVAIERHIEIFRANKHISKQAAAVLQAGLEHIDQICGLKVRATGMEGYQTTPRAACEDADISERTLTDRAGEIGAKILNWLIKLLEAVEVLTLKYSEGIVRIISQFQGIKDSATSGTLPEVTLKRADGRLFLKGEFVGDKLSFEEKALPAALKNNRKEIMSQVIQPLLAILRSGQASEEMAEDIKELSTKFDANGERALPMPGNTEVVAKGISLTYESGKFNYDHDSGDQSDVTVPAMPVTTLKRNVEEIINYLNDLTDTGTAMAMLSAGSNIKSAIIDLRGRSKGGDEAVFQKVQSATMSIVSDVFHQRLYFRVLGDLANAQTARASYFTKRLTGRGDDE